MTETPSPARAELTTGSIISLAPIAQARMVGSQWFVFAYQVAGFVVGLLVGEVLLRLVPIAMIVGGRLLPTYEIVDIARIMLAIVGWSVGLKLAQGRHQKRFLAGIRRRGTPVSVATTYAAADDALHIDGERMSYRVAWNALLEIIPSPEGWLIQADMLTFQLPNRAFVGEDEERAFLRAVLDRVRPEVRERSVEAASFATSA